MTQFPRTSARRAGRRLAGRRAAGGRCPGVGGGRPPQGALWWARRCVFLLIPALARPQGRIAELQEHVRRVSRGRFARVCPAPPGALGSPPTAPTPSRHADARVHWAPTRMFAHTHGRRQLIPEPRGRGPDAQQQGRRGADGRGRGAGRFQGNKRPAAATSACRPSIRPAATHAPWARQPRVAEHAPHAAFPWRPFPCGACALHFSPRPSCPALSTPPAQAAALKVGGGGRLHRPPPGGVDAHDAVLSAAC
jgi:hypothetical protein